MLTTMLTANTNTLQSWGESWCLCGVHSSYQCWFMNVELAPRQRRIYIRGLLILFIILKYSSPPFYLFNWALARMAREGEDTSRHDAGIRKSDKHKQSGHFKHFCQSLASDSLTVSCESSEDRAAAKYQTLRPKPPPLAQTPCWKKHEGTSEGVKVFLLNHRQGFPPAPPYFGQRRSSQVESTYSPPVHTNSR